MIFYTDFILGVLFGDKSSPFGGSLTPNVCIEDL
jgi:hypothetical protein